MQDNTSKIVSQAEPTSTGDAAPKNSDALVVSPVESVSVTTVIEDELLAEIERLDPDDFLRLKTPLGGSTFIEISDPVEGSRAEKELVINVLAHRKNRRWFSKTGEESDVGVPPDCTAYDGLLGQGDPGGFCANCRLSRPGSKGNGNAPACEERLNLYFLRSGSPIPIVFSLSPSSARAISRTLLAILGTGAPLYSFIVQLKFREASFAGKRFAVAELTVVGRLQPEQARYAGQLSRIVQSKVDAKIEAWRASKP